MHVTTLLTVSEVRLKFPKFAPNSVISFHSCQSNREQEFHAELRWEVIRQVHCGEIVSEFPYTLWSRRLGITSFKMSYKTLQMNFPRCHPTPT